MKKLNLSIRSLFVLCLAAVSVAANAQQVSQEEAANIALQFLKGNGSQNSRLKKATPEALKLVYTEPSAKDKSANLYVYNMEGGGFAIVSADARTGSQILGYSFDNNFSAKGMPDNVKYWLGEYSRQIDYIKAHQPEVSESKRRGGLKKDNSGPIPASPTVAPLLSTTWGQDVPYNGMTPTLSGEHTRTGCVATAMAQIMNYWEWPEKGTSSHSYYWIGGKNYCSSEFSNHTYDWDNMTDSYDGTQYSDQNQSMVAVAQLMSDCGIAVDMDYGLTASGAYDDKVASALTTYFGYTSNLSLKHQSDYATKEEWNNILTNELDFSRPVYYSADDATPNDEDGHAFVLDGYGTINNETYFHINWGWDGYDGFGNQDTDISNDGYFAMNVFNTEYHNTGEIDCYNLNSMAIVNIYPADKDEITFNNLPQMWTDDGNEGNWDDIGNWNTSAVDFGIGAWKDNVAFPDITANMPLKRQQHDTYKDIYRITVLNWDKQADDKNVSLIDEDADKNLIFYWNSATNDCYIPSQYTNLHLIIEGRELFYVNNGTTGTYDAGNDQFLIIFDTNKLQMPKPANNCTFEWSNDPDAPEELYQAIMAAYNAGSSSFTYKNGGTYQYSLYVIDDSKIHFKISGNYATPSIRTFSNLDCIININKNITATLTLNLPEHNGLYLDDFNENQDGTATQYAGIYNNFNETSSIYYRLGLMPVNENTTNSGIMNFAKGLTGDVTEVETEAESDLEEIEIPAEGAYYVVAAYYDNDQGTTFLSYEYMPVFYSRSDKWETISGDCEYTDVLMCSINGHSYSYPDPSTNDVTVQQYKGGDLIENVGDRIFRIKNPYGEYYAEKYKDEDGEYEYARYDEEGDTYREDVYLYLYVRADNTVSLYPNCFEYQPTGVDLGYSEIMVKLNDGAQGEFSANTGTSGYIITFDNESLTTVESLYYVEYKVDGGTDQFTLTIPSALTELIIYDDKQYAILDPTLHKYNTVSYSRSLTEDNNWGTLMLPFEFDTDEIEGFEFYELTEATSELLTFSKYDGENGTVAANTPVIFKRIDETKDLEVSETTVSPETYVTLYSCGADQKYSTTTDAGWSFVGVYYNSTDAGNEGKAITASSENPSLAQCYFFEGNEIWNVTERMDLYQYRGYFVTANPTGAKRIPVRFNDEEYTSLDALFNGEQPVKKYGKGRFNLQGQAVGKDYKGVVIEDGRKKISY